MTKNPPNRRGITFEVGAQLEARDRLKKWYAAHIEEIDYEEGKVLIHFKRWNHRYDEWFCWDSPYLRPLEKIQLRREGLVEEEPQVVYRVNEHVLACWSDCRFYPAKITAINKDGTYTVKFFDGVVQTVKNIHVKASSKDQANLSRTKQREKVDNTSSSDKHRGTFWEQKKSTENTDLKKVKSSASGQKPPAPSEKKLLFSERTKPLEKNPVKDEKEDKENISENEREHSVDPQCEERAAQNDTLKTSQENGEIRKKVCMSSSSSMPSDSSSHSLQPVTLELRRRKISIGPEIQSKRPRLDKKNNSSDEKVGEKNEKFVLDDEQKAAIEDIRGNEDNEHLVQYLANGTKGTLHIMAENPLPPPAQEESFEELVSVSNQSKEVYRILSSASTQEPTEAKEASEPESIMKSTAADLFMDSAEKEQSTQNNSDATTVTVTNTLKKTNNPAPKAVTLDLDPTRFKCKLLDCSKFFRKAKLLHYHMKYFHGIEKAEQDQSTVSRPMQTRGFLAHEQTTRDPTKRRWTTPGSLYLPKLHDMLSERRHSTPATIITCLHRQSLREKSQEKEIQKVYQVPDRLSVEVSDKAREKSKDSFNPKSKKKRKKKRSKSELSGSDENIDLQKAPSLKKTALAMPNHDFKSQFPLRNPLLRSLDPGLQRDAAKISDEDTLSDSCTESLLWSDEDYNEEIDVTNADEEDGDCEIVRCICEVQEENDFMIQCEDCLCWQHGPCMGLLEDDIPESYSCYICQDPPGQRLSLKYWYDKEWLNKGYMHGLPFLEENYSHQNAKKIVSTHQLLGDIQRVIEVLHGLQLKIGILQSKEQQDMNYWGQPWKHMLSDKCYIRCSSEEGCKEDSANYRTYNGEADKPPPLPAIEESYITSEHCYQKPRTYYPAVEQRLVVETRSSALDAGVQQIRQSREDSIAERLGWELDRELIKSESESKHNYCKVRECLTKRNPSQESSKPLDNGDATINKQIQWQLNLLAHLESLQDEVTHRMDFIEKELDVLESFLDYTGELEPPEPLARLPQLKHRIKQLLMDLGKVEQVALCYST